MAPESVGAGAGVIVGAGARALRRGLGTAGAQLFTPRVQPATPFLCVSPEEQERARSLFR